MITRQPDLIFQNSAEVAACIALCKGILVDVGTDGLRRFGLITPYNLLVSWY